MCHTTTPGFIWKLRWLKRWILKKSSTILFFYSFRIAKVREKNRKFNNNTHRARISNYETSRARRWHGEGKQRNRTRQCRWWWMVWCYKVWRYFCLDCWHVSEMCLSWSLRSTPVDVFVLCMTAAAALTSGSWLAQEVELGRSRKMFGSLGKVS